jgi:hypothetical protein
MIAPAMNRVFRPKNLKRNIANNAKARPIIENMIDAISNLTVFLNISTENKGIELEADICLKNMSNPPISIAVLCFSLVCT